jgi:hypothetical protein
MSSIRQSISAALASAAAIGLVTSIGLAPVAAATPCSGDAANAPPPPGAIVTSPGATTLGPVGGRGPRPRGANERAPLPQRGLISRLLSPTPGSRYSAPIQQQAAPGANPAPPSPAPHPPAAGQQIPNAGQATPNAAPVPPPTPAPGPGPQPAPEGAGLGGAATSLIDWVTGPDSPNKTLDRFGISGTDLGIPWDSGNGELMAFGDTFGYCAVNQHQWRYNTLFSNQDHDLSHGIHGASSPMRAPNFAKQIINSIKYSPQETGVIPTAGVSVGGKQYVNFMSIKDWGRDGEWSTNYSGIAVSTDNGQNWGVYPGTIRGSNPDAGRAKFVPGNENFQMGSYLKGNDGYMYSYGTPSGRGGSAFLARVPQNAIPDLSKYQYWNGDGGGHWVPNNPGAATPVIPGPVAEMSTQYNTYLKQYLVMYTNGANDVVARTAPTPQGPWSPESMLVSSWQMPGGIYAPMMHPWSTGKDVYFNLSIWSAYNVMLMHTVLQ